ncbi:MAG: cupin domain-containing protein [Sedimenticola sp.]
MVLKQLNPYAAALSFSLVTCAAPAFAGDTPRVQGAPETNRGFSTLLKQAVELGQEIPGMDGRQLRLRLLTIEPGGHIKVHSHKNRPAAFYVIRGATTITYGDGTVKRFPAGSMGYADKNTVHWHRNNGSESVVFVAADIFQPKKM